MACVTCRKPRYKRLVDSLFPANPADSNPVNTDLEKLIFLARSSPDHLDRIGEYLEYWLRRSVVRERHGHIQVAVKVTERLISHCDSQQVKLMADSYLNMIRVVLESNTTDLQIFATNSFVAFSNHEEENTPYHRQYNFLIDRFAVLACTPEQQESHLQIRVSGLKALKGLLAKMRREQELQLTIWEPDHLSKIVSAFLINMQDQASEIQPAELDELALEAKGGLQELVRLAGLGHIDDVIRPIMRHFDASMTWTGHRQFTEKVFLCTMEAMQKQDRYKVLQGLVNHLDADASIKEGVLTTLSNCVAMGADGSVGPFVLEVFQTLIRHLRAMCESSSGSDLASFQAATVRAMGEFARALPDYQKPDILILINDHVTPPQANNSMENQRLTGAILKCLRAVADTYRPSVLEMGYAEPLFLSLLKVLRFSDPGFQLDVAHIWHRLIDRHQNKGKIPFTTTWERLEDLGLSLGTVSQSFIDQVATTLHAYLCEHAQILSTSLENLKAFYQLLALLLLECGSAIVSDATSYLSRLQETALTNSALTARHRIALHAILEEGVGAVVSLRRSLGPYLLPDVFFAEVSPELPVSCVEVPEDLLFRFIGGSPSRARSLVKRDGSISGGIDVTSSLSQIMDATSQDTPHSLEQVTFESLKDGPLSDNALENDNVSELSWNEKVFRAAHADFGFQQVQDIVNSAGSRTDMRESRSRSVYEIELPKLY
ncbi:hypothetical protein EMCRGX_G022364 [Ephydatia muelleri]